MTHYKWRSRVLLACFALTLGILSSGCFFRILQITVTTTQGGYPDYAEGHHVGIGIHVEASTCDENTSIPEFYGCTYTITGADGLPIGITSTFELVSEYGFFGLLIDPLILQVPAGVGGASGTVDTGDAIIPLVVTHAQQFKAGPKVTVMAEPGMQFIIVELPEGVANSIGAAGPGESNPFDLTLDLSPSALPMPIKSMFTVRIDDPEGTYYLPMTPCTTDFGTVPAMMIGPGSAQTVEADIEAMIDAYASGACDGKVYDLRTIPAPGDPGVHSLVVPGLAAN